jgi:choline dehydrogenase-like flavoprotein
MPIIDMRSLDGSTAIDAEVCIMGAGAAGLVLAASLARRGVPVAVLEAGGRACTNERDAGMAALVEADNYRAASDGRAFGLGGTTSLWGGQLIPHSELDFRGARIQGFDFWRHVVAVVSRHAESLSAMLGLRPMCEWFRAEECLPRSVVAALRANGVEALTADWLPFRHRNLSFLAERQGALGEGRIYLNAPAVKWHLNTGASGLLRVESVLARAYGRTLTVRARAYAIATGAIESTRILLEMERAAGRPFRTGSALGRCLADHLSCPVADVLKDNRALCRHLLAPRFRNGRMRSLRFVERDAPEDAPRGFFHFVYENEDPGFALARKVLLGFQSHTMPAVSWLEVARGVAGTAALAWNRFARRRLYIPKGAPSHLQLDVEQLRNPANHIALSDHLDASGRPTATVRWSVSTADEEAIRAAAVRFLRAWPQHKSFPRLLATIGEGAAPKPHDVYHPVGTCQMGTDGEAVVDPELRVHGAANLWCASTAVFPSAGTANPTFSLLCLAAGLADRLADRAAVSRIA